MYSIARHVYHYFVVMKYTAAKYRYIDVHTSRKYKDYVYGRCKYRSTWKNKEYFKSKYKAKDDMMYQDYIIAYVKIQIKWKWRYTIQYVKPTAQPVFKNRFPKDGPTCRRQAVNPRHQTSQGQSIAKPETPLQNIQVE